MLGNPTIHYEDDVFDVQGFLQPLDFLADLVGRADDLKPALDHLLEGLRNRPFLSFHAQRFEEDRIRRASASRTPILDAPSPSPLRGCGRRQRCGTVTTPPPLEYRPKRSWRPCLAASST